MHGEAFCEISGYSKDELIGTNHRIIRHPDMQESTYKVMETITSGKTWKGEIKIKEKWWLLLGQSIYFSCIW